MAEEIDLSPAEDAALERAWARVGPLLAPCPDVPFAVTGPDLSGLGDLLNLSRQEVLDALFDAALDSFDLALPDAAFYSPDQPRVPAGSPGGGRWAGGVSPGTAAARDAASDAVRAFAGGQGPPTAAEAEALAGHLARLTVGQIHALKAEHGLRGSAPNKAALVAKMAQRFAAWRAGRAPKEAVPDWPADYDVFGKRDVFADEPVAAGTLEPAAPPASAAKEPWQQTRKAYVGSGPGRHTRGLEHGEAIKQAILAGKEVPERVLRDYPGFAERVRAEREAAKNPPPDPRQAERDRLAEWSRKAVADPTSVKAHDFAHYAHDPAAEAAWQRRQDGASRSQHYAEIHRKAVEAAISAGKPVPPEVLADYPDLAAKAAPPPPAPPPAPVPATVAAGNHAALVAGAFRDLDAAGGGHNFVILSDLKKATGLSVPDLHAAVNDLRRRGILTGSGLEGRHGVTPEQWEASIPEPDGHRVGYVSARDPAKLAAAAGPAPAPAAPPPPAPPPAGEAPAPAADHAAAAEGLQRATREAIEAARASVKTVRTRFGPSETPDPAVAERETARLLSHLEDLKARFPSKADAQKLGRVLGLSDVSGSADAIWAKIRSLSEGRFGSFLRAYA